MLVLGSKYLCKCQHQISQSVILVLSSARPSASSFTFDPLALIAATATTSASSRSIYLDRLKALELFLRPRLQSLHPHLRLYLLHPFNPLRSLEAQSLA